MRRNCPNMMVKDHYDGYLAVKTAKKTSVEKDIHLKPKENHKDREYADISLSSHDNTHEYILRFYGNRDWHGKFSVNLFDKAFMEIACFRYDSFGGPHVNYKDIPLRMRVVTSPHFNEYDSEGVDIAYKTDKLQDPAFAATDRITALKHFAEIHNIRLNDDIAIHASTLFEPETGVVDPLKEVVFYV